MKYAISFFGILIMIIGSVLFYQYQAYSVQLQSEDDAFSYSQEIEINVEDERLEIHHHYKNLPNRRISINWPKQIDQPGCLDEAKTNCSRLSKDLKRFDRGDGEEQSISYEYPLEGGLKPAQLFKDLFVMLKNGQVSHSTVHIKTKPNVTGEWVTGLPLVGEQQSLVNYTMFSGDGPVSELYYQQEGLQLQEHTEMYSIYSNSPIPKELIDLLNEISSIHKEHIAIVHNQNIQSHQGERIIFTKELSIESLQEDIILTKLHTKYQFKQLPKWVSEVIASFLTDSTIGGEKARQMTTTLRNHMSSEMQKQWKQKLIELEGKEITGKLLDEQLSNVFGKQIEYFTVNLQTDELKSFYFVDHRKVFVNSTYNKELKVIFYEGEVLYSADELLTSLGYEVQFGKNGYYVNNEIRQYRFPMGYGFYVYNQRRYNTVSDPFKMIDERLYIEESWLQKLFFVEMEKEENTISINESNH